MDKDSFYAAVKACFDRYCMGFSGDVLLGFSGGSDSVALFWFLKRFCDQNGKKLFCVHVNHMMRALEAERDEDFCSRFCKERGVPLCVIKKDVPALIKKEGLSPEDAARRLRYEAIFEAADHFGVSTVALAHNLDDNAETMLLSLFRGTSLRSLCGIPPRRSVQNGGRDLLLIRPLLDIKKCDIEGFCVENALDFVTDSTNFSDKYSRSYLRNKLLLGALDINARAPHNMLRSADILRADEDFIDGIAMEICKKYGISNSAPRRIFFELHDALCSRVLMKMSRSVADTNISFCHIEAALALVCSDATVGTLHFPDGIRFYLEGDTVRFSMGGDLAVPFEKTELHLGENVFSEQGVMIFLLPEGENAADILDRYENIYKKSIKVVLNSDNICGKLFVESPKFSEKYRYGGMMHTVKKTLSDKKVPIGKRKKLPALYDGDGIVWLPYCSPRDDVKNPAAQDKKISIYYFEM